MKRIKVYIVDDSATVRRVLQDVLSRDPTIEIIGTASDPLFAEQKLKNNWPDVIVLDVEMPRMDGVTFLRKIMAERPTPVVICSTLTTRGAKTTMDALGAGAVAIVEKPKMGLKDFLQDAASDLVQVVKTAARANVKNIRINVPAPVAPPKYTADVILDAPAATRMRTTERIVAIGTSTGGTQALESVLCALPDECPGLVVVQHMPEKFTAAFAERLDSVCKIRVKEACTGDRILPGHALIAPGGFHMIVQRSGAQYRVDVVEGPPVNRHRPSVDVLFRSVAKSAGENALGIIMTGMGNDGAVGLREMHDAGALTLAQDEATCVVFGMPKEAIKLGAADHVVPLGRIPAAVMEFGRGG